MRQAAYDEPSDEPCDDAESAVRQGLLAAAGALTPSPWPAAAVRARAGRRRRARRLAAVLPVLAAVAVTAVLTAPQLRDRAAGGPPDPTGQGTALPDGPAAEVVPADRSVDVGAGLRMRLAPTKVCFSAAGGAWQCEAAPSDDGGTAWIRPEARPAPDGTVYVPLYVGPASPARMTLATRGHRYPLRMAVLPGAPGYTAGYLAVPLLFPGSLPEATVTAYDRQGRVLATVTVPASG